MFWIALAMAGMWGSPVPLRCESTQKGFDGSAISGGIRVLSRLDYFVWTSNVQRLRNPVLLFDAAGLTLFAVAGTQKPFTFGVNPVAAAQGIEASRPRAPHAR